MESCRIKLVLKWSQAISKLQFFSGCSGKDLVQGFGRIWRPDREFAAGIFLHSGSWPAASLSSVGLALFCVREQALLGVRNALLSRVRHKPEEQHPCHDHSFAQICVCCSSLV